MRILWAGDVDKNSICTCCKPRAQKDITMNKKIAKAKGEFRGNPEFFQYDNFTVCILQVEDCRFIGVAKRNPNCDSDKPERAKTIAYERALKGESVRL